MPHLKDDPPWCLSREGQISVVAEQGRHTGDLDGYMAAIVPLPEFRPYRWQERPRRPVMAPKEWERIEAAIAAMAGSG